MMKHPTPTPRILVCMLVCMLTACTINAHNGQTPWPRRHLLAPTNKPEPALGDVHTPFSRADIPADVQSTVDCKQAKTGSTPEPMVCIYKNVILYKGVFHVLMTAKPPPEEAWALARMQVGGAKISRYAGTYVLTRDHKYAPTVTHHTAPCKNLAYPQTHQQHVSSWLH